MNKSFKVVFNKARGALMVVNEVTSCVQAKGTKTVIAAAVGALAAGVAGATEIPEIPEGVKADTVEVTDWKDIDSQNVFETGAQKIVMFHTVKDQKSFEGDLWVVSKNAATSAKGFYVNGEKADFINEGNIYITSEASWKNQAILADVGGKATNEGLIVAKNAYGMTVGTTSNGDKGSTIINNNRIVVEETGVGMELGGADGSTAVNKGTIVVGTPVEGGFTHGVLIKDTSNNEFTNYGTIEAAEGATAIEVQVSKEDGVVTGTTAGNILNFEAGSKIVGEVHIQAEVTGTVINANGFQGELALNNESKQLTINVKDGAELKLADGYGSTISEAVIENGKLTASIWQSYTDADGKEASDNIFEKVVVKEDGIFNVKQLNSGGTKDKSHDTLLIKGSECEWTLDGGALQVGGQNFTGNLKVGTASDVSNLTIESGDYSYASLNVAKKGATTVAGGSLTLGDLTLSDGNTKNSALVYVGENGSLTVNGTLSAKGTYASQTVGSDSVQGVYVAGDLILGSDAKFELADNALTVDGELNASQSQIFKAMEGEGGTTYRLAEGADKIAFTEGAGLLLSDNVSMTQKDFTDFLGKLQGTWGEGVAPEIVFTNVAFQGDVTFDTALGYNAYATEVAAGEEAFEGDTTTLSVKDDVAVGALKVDAGTEVVDLNHAAGKEFVFAGLGGNVITGVDSVKTITSDGEVTLGWDETSKGVVNAETLEAKELFVSGQFEATNAVVTSGEIDRFGSLKLAKLSQADGAAAQDVFTIHQEATLNLNFARASSILTKRLFL